MSTPPSPGPSAQDAARQEAAKAVGRATLTFGVCMIAVIVCSMQPLPWCLAALAFGVATFVYGIRAMKVMRSAASRSAFLTPVASMQWLVVIGLAMTAMSMLQPLLQAVTYPISYRYQTCLAQAITDSAVADCDAEFRSSLLSYLPTGFAPLVPANS